jgi:hypothetical protein
MLSKQDLDFHRGLVIFGGIHLAWLAAGRNLTRLHFRFGGQGPACTSVSVGRRLRLTVIGLTVAGD